MPHVFLSYCREDLARVEPFQAALKNSGVPIWLDSQSMQPGANLPASIEAGLRDAGGAVIFLSETYLHKGWTQAEMRYFTTRMIRDPELRLIIVRLDECEVPPLLESVLRSAPGDASVVAKVLAEALGLTVSTAGSPTGRETIPSTEFFKEISDTAILSLTELVLTKCANAPFRKDPELLPFETKEFGAVLLKFMRPVSDISVMELRTAHNILGIDRRSCARFDEMIRAGGLGIFVPAFEIQLEKKTIAYQEKLLEIRDQTDQLVNAIFRDAGH